MLFTFVGDARDAAAARLLVASLRAFGGDLGTQSFTVFAAVSAAGACRGLADATTDVVPLSLPKGLAGVPFGGLAAACARAEEVAGDAELVWLDPSCLVVRPPELFVLGDGADVAVRPVHLCNVGSLRASPPDAYWRRIFGSVGVDDVEMTVESFVDGCRLRAYFNSHGVAVRRSLGLFARRLDLLRLLVADRRFQEGPCAGALHRTFLFQAVFSALVAGTVDGDRVRVLPPAYNYPYNLHDRVPPEKRPPALDDLVCLTYEGRSLRPADVTDVAIREPLRSWLATRAP